MLDNEIKNQLAQYMSLLESDIDIHFFNDNSTQSHDMKALLNDVISVGKNKISLMEKPSDKLLFSIGKKDKKHRVIFKTIPMGHEFSTLIMALLQVSGRKPKISEEELTELFSFINKVHEPITLKSYISLTCHNCPDVVQALNIVAIHSETFTHEIIDGSLYKKEVEALGIMAVPSVFHDDKLFLSGKMNFSQIIKQLKDKFFSKEILEEEIYQKTNAFNQMPTFDQIIVGGGPSGSSAAIYSARKGLNVAILSTQFGGQVQDTLGIENYLSLLYTEGPKLVKEMEKHVIENKVPILKDEMSSIKKIDNIFNIHLKSGAEIKAKSVILSTGAKWRELNIPGEKEFKNKGVAYCPHCDGPLFKGKKVAVVGGGNSGVEAAIDLAGIVEHVTLIEFSPQLKADKVLQDKLKSLKNVDILTNVASKSIIGKDSVNAMELLNRQTNDVFSIDISGVFVQIGLTPNTQFEVSDGEKKLDLNQFGEIIVNHKNNTNITGLFASGDCSTSPFKQIIIAVGDGAKASLSAFEYLSFHP